MDITYLKGVGPKRAELYRKLGIETAEQLIELYPRDYVDLTAPVTVAQAHIGEVCAFSRFCNEQEIPVQRVRENGSVQGGAFRQHWEYHGGVL